MSRKKKKKIRRKLRWWVFPRLGLVPFSFLYWH